MASYNYLALVAAVACSFAAAASTLAESPQMTVLPAIDLSPGADVEQPSSFALNRATHKLYVSGYSGRMHGVKVIDTVTNTAVGGLSFTGYPGGPPMTGHVMAVDEGPAPKGNKLYVAGRASNPYIVRVIDGATYTEVTGRGTDIVLPFTVLTANSGPGVMSMVANPKTHKVYVANYDGHIAVIDGPARKLITSFNPDAGNFLVLDPAANKVLVLGANGGAIIDGATDTVTAPPQPLLFRPSAAVFNEVDQRIYIAGADRGLIDSYGIFVLDGSSGTLVASRKFPEVYGLSSIALAPARNAMFAGTPYKLFAFTMSDLSLSGEFAVPAPQLAYDGGGSAMLLATESLYELHRNAIRMIQPASGGVAGYIATAYHPQKVVVNRKTNRIYVLDELAQEFIVLDGAKRSVLARVPTPPSRAYYNARDIAVSERLNRVYLTSVRYAPALPVPGAPPADEPRMLDVYDGDTLQLISSRKMNYYPATLGIDDTRRRIYAGRMQPTSGTGFDWYVDVYDADSEALIASVRTSSDDVFSAGSGSLAVNPVTGRIYQATRSGRLSVIDGNTLTVLPYSIDSAMAPQAMAFNLRRNELNLVDRNTVATVDSLSDRLVRSFPAGGPHELGETGLTGIAADEEADTINVTDVTWNGERFVNRLLAYDAQSSGSLVKQTELESRPAGVMFDPATRQFIIPHTQEGTISVVQAAGTPARDQFGNLSTRLQVGGDDDVMISGFIVEGPPGSTKKIIVRAVGPSLRPLGVEAALPDTALELHTSSGAILANDNWRINAATDSSQQALIDATGLAPAHDLEAAIIADLPPGAHTAVIRGKEGAVGGGLAEVFVLGQDAPAQLANMATRGRVGTGDNVMIGGLIVTGPTASRALVRAIGPSLQDRLQGVLEDPVLELYDINGGLIATNDDWRSPHADEIAATTIAPTDDRESAIVATLHAGNYTAIVRGKDGTSGVAIVEAYRLP